MKSYTIKAGLVWAGLSVAFFFLCMLWGWVLIDATLKTLHFNLLQITYPGFGISIAGISIAIAEAVLYGFLFGTLYVWLTKVFGVSNK